jgi:hypothetical protein
VIILSQPAAVDQASASGAIQNSSASSFGLVLQDDLLGENVLKFWRVTRKKRSLILMPTFLLRAEAPHARRHWLLKGGLRGIEWESFAAEGLIKRCIV